MKRFFIALIGGTVILIGVAMLVLPGPGALVIAGGMAILATEFVWARRALRSAKGAVAKARRKSGLKEWLRLQKERTSMKFGTGHELPAKETRFKPCRSRRKEACEALKTKPQNS